MSRESNRRTSRMRDRPRGSDSSRADPEKWVREFQRNVLDGLASAKADRLVDGEIVFARLEALIERAGRTERGPRAGRGR